MAKQRLSYEERKAAVLKALAVRPMVNVSLAGHLRWTVTTTATYTRRMEEEGHIRWGDKGWVITAPNVEPDSPPLIPGRYEELTVPGLSYVGAFLADEEQQNLLKQLEGLEYHHDTMLGNPSKFQRAQFGYEIGRAHV